MFSENLNSNINFTLNYIHEKKIESFKKSWFGLSGRQNWKIHENEKLLIIS